ncbi:MAG: histidine kinase dimerization/phosphoacceptor domain -containing protein [Bacteroidota bacterium]
MTTKIRHSNNYYRASKSCWLKKEWLIREIHHRVKNNFHIVIGLLGTQSEYVKNEEALTAISETKQRIHAMSLLHQKLYQSTDLSDVHMPDYIFELVVKSSREL